MLVYPSNSPSTFPYQFPAVQQTLGAWADTQNQPGHCFYGYSPLLMRNAGYPGTLPSNARGGDCVYENRNRKYAIGSQDGSVSPPGVTTAACGSPDQLLVHGHTAALSVLPSIGHLDQFSSSPSCSSSESSPTNAQLHPGYGWPSDVIQPSTPNPERTRTREKYRVVYSEKQRVGLEKAYKANKFITTQCKVELSRTLDLSERQIKIWFQNRRAKERKQRRRQDEASSLVASNPTSNDGNANAICSSTQQQVDDTHSFQHTTSGSAQTSPAAGSDLTMGFYNRMPTHQGWEQPFPTTNYFSYSISPGQMVGSTTESCFVSPNSHRNSVDRDVLGSVHRISDLNSSY